MDIQIIFSIVLTVFTLLSTALGVLCLFILKGIKEDIKEIREDIKSIDRRLSHLEGRFEERGYWESRKTGTEHQHSRKNNHGMV